MERAKECLPNDNNNLSQANKDFMKKTLSQFDKEGEVWRQNGGITEEQRKKLKEMIHNFEHSYKKTYDPTEGEKIDKEKMMRSEILDIIHLVKDD